MKLFILFILFNHINSFVFSQKDTVIYQIDSLLIYHMPLYSKGSFTLNEAEFRNTISPLKRKEVLKEKDLINDIYNNILEQDKIINKKNLSVLVIFDFYSAGKVVNTVLMDCVGLISVKSNCNQIFFDYNLNIFFKELTKQENVICGG